MGWEYTNADRVLAGPNRFRFKMRRYLWNGMAITGCATNKGGIKKTVEIGLDGKERTTDVYNPRAGKDVGSGEYTDIEFQFPPKVLSDNRKGNWEEGDLTGGQEPVAFFKTSGPREITLTWTYVVDTLDSSPITGWTIERITRNIRTLRGYFALSRGVGAERDGLVIEFHMWCIGGDTPTTGRIKSIDVKYGETMVFPSSLSDRAFPLRTDITVDFRLWTKGSDPHKTTKDSDGKDVPGLATKIPMQDLNALENYEHPSWY